MSDLSAAAATAPLATQVGGDHYKNFAIQPVEHLEGNGIAHCLPNVCKYIMRYRAKDGARDLRKCLHYLDLYAHLARERRAAPKDVIEMDRVLAMCAANNLQHEQILVLLATQTEFYGHEWPEIARLALERLLVREYGAEAGA